MTTYDEYLQIQKAQGQPAQSYLYWKHAQNIMNNQDTSEPPNQSARPKREPQYTMNDLNNLIEGKKFDEEKNRLDLLPVDALEEIAKVLTFGAKKYGDRNWEQGMKWSRLYRAAIGHLFSWWKGEEADSETGLSHLAHAACCVIFLLSYQLRNGYIHSDKQNQTEFDNRP